MAMGGEPGEGLWEAEACGNRPVASTRTLCAGRTAVASSNAGPLPLCEQADASGRPDGLSASRGRLGCATTRRASGRAGLTDVDPFPMDKVDSTSDSTARSRGSGRRPTSDLRDSDLWDGPRGRTSPAAPLSSETLSPTRPIRAGSFDLLITRLILPVVYACPPD